MMLYKSLFEQMSYNYRIPVLKLNNEQIHLNSIQNSIHSRHGWLVL